MDSFDCQNIKEWFPQNIIGRDEPIALLILNQPLNEDNKQFVKNHWESALFRVAVDGGANRLKELWNNELTLMPDLICGDFDSISPENLDFFKSKGAEVEHTPDQDETDFTKALRLTEKYLKKRSIQVSSILAVVSTGDRLDHLFGNINTLFQAVEITSAPVLILGFNSLTWLLSVGCHRIHVADFKMDCHVGVIPVGSECNDVTTTGLKWNLTNGKMSFGDLISTSNEFDGSGVVTIKTDSPLIWTMELDSAK